MSRSLCAAALLLLTQAACVAPIPFDTVTLGGAPSATPGPAGTFAVELGLATAEYQAVVPFGGRALPADRTAFGDAEQRELADVLRKELLRLRVFERLDDRDAPAAGADEARLTLRFERTHYETYLHHYTLRAEVRAAHGAKTFRETYAIDGNAGASGWELANSNLFEARLRVVRHLLEAVVPDLQRWVAADAPTDQGA